MSVFCILLGQTNVAFSQVLTTFGDSNTAHNIYQTKLQKLLPGYSIKNRGVSGNTTRDGVNRIDSVLKMDNPDILFIKFGTNNTSFPQIVYKDTTAMVQRAKQFGVGVILVSTVGYTGVSGRDDAIPVINDAIRRAVMEQEVRLVETFTALEETGENYLREPKHYNDFGHQIIAETIHKTLTSKASKETVGALRGIGILLLGNGS